MLSSNPAFAAHRKPIMNLSAAVEPIGFIKRQFHGGRVRQDQQHRREGANHAMDGNTIEKRAAQRHRVFKGATISFGGNGVACTVRNLSASGAALDIPGSISLPPSFMLTIESDRFIRRCHPVWSNDKRIGVAFD
jgi:hypothetical protein